MKQNPFAVQGASTQFEYPHEIDDALGAPERDHAAFGNLFQWITGHGLKGPSSHRAIAVRLQVVRYFLKAGSMKSLASEIGVTKARICQAVGEFARQYNIKLECMRCDDAKANMSKTKTEWHQKHERITN